LVLQVEGEPAEAIAEDPFSGSISASRRICFKIIQVPLISNLNEAR
jgi:hypothetical protein